MVYLPNETDVAFVFNSVYSKICSLASFRSILVKSKRLPLLGHLEMMAKQRAAKKIDSSKRLEEQSKDFGRETKYMDVNSL